MTCICEPLRKREDERLDWRIDYSAFLIEGDTLKAADVPMVDGIDIVTAIEGASVRLWIDGGTRNQAYRIPLKVTTQAGRIRTDCLKLRVR